MLPRKRISHYGFGFLILSVSSSISSILFYQIRPNLSKVGLVCTRLHFVRLSFPFSRQLPYLLITEHQPVNYKLYFLSDERLFSLTLNGIAGGGVEFTSSEVFPPLCQNVWNKRAETF